MQRSIFEQIAEPTEVPLAEKVRPRQLEDIKGHKNLLSPQAALRQMIEKDEYGSFILWGPPGSGKTTIARLIESRTSLTFYSFSAVLSKIADVKALMEKAKQLHLYKNKTGEGKCDHGSKHRP